MKGRATKMKTEKILEIKNVEMTPASSNRFALGCHFEGAQYHVWIDRKTMTIEPILYKNPPDHVKRGNPAYYRTRKMKVGSKFTEDLVHCMVHVMNTDDLLAKMDAKLIAEENARVVSSNQADRDERIRNAAPKLLEALDEAAHECSNAYHESDLKRLRELAQGWAQLVGKCQ